MTAPDAAHVERFVPATSAGAVPLVLLHGTGGTELDLLPLADRLAPGAAKIGIRGTVAIEGGYAFFRRRPDRRVDEDDLAAKARVLAGFMAAAGTRHGLGRRPVAVGFSNGAIMAAALLLNHPGLLAGAVLFRPLSPFRHDPPPRPGSASALVIDGAADDRRSPGDGLRAARQLTRAGVLVSRHLLPAGHLLTDDDERIARAWLHRG